MYDNANKMSTVFVIKKKVFFKWNETLNINKKDVCA